MQYRLSTLLLLISFPLFSANYHTWSTSKIYIARQQIIMRYMVQKKKLIPDVKALAQCDLDLRKLDNELMRRTKTYTMSR